MTVRVNPLI
uniref:Uncharacterized protein n=1 Tax=Anguilla anguilla TaxID=7936 RepID=A0A0E9UGD3_ANGAN